MESIRYDGMSMRSCLMAALILEIFLGGKAVFAVNEKSDYIGIMFYQKFFGNVHQNYSRYSATLTTVSCGHPIKVYKQKVSGDAKTADNFSDWQSAKVGPYDGYVLGALVGTVRPDCFQDQFPKFFEQFDLDLAELFYWGRLYDQYIIGRSMVK
ncbi:MAG TPA: hypothetical protein VI754_07085 [Bacteriovoracaceae bacterium]|nr:hypothetical protein [Bacteriovoracaceae bacterium]